MTHTGQNLRTRRGYDTFKDRVVRVLRQRIGAWGTKLPRNEKESERIAVVSGRREMDGAENCCYGPTCLRKIEKLKLRIERKGDGEQSRRSLRREGR